MKNLKRNFVFIFITLTVFFIPNLININIIFAASPHITNFLLNGKSQDVTFNPNNTETVSIDVTADVAVKFTRIYICAEALACTGSVGAYTKYFTDSTITSVISKSWDGKNVAKEIVPEGTYKVRVSMTKDSEAAVLEDASFKIIVSYSTGSDTSGGDSSATSTATSTGSTDSSETINNSSSGVSYSNSVHYIQEDLSDYAEPTSFQVSAGRDRLSYTNSPVNFIAKHKTSQNLANNSCHYEWSFGDGTSKTGEKVEHVFKYPGDYNIVLNGSCIDLESVSRTTIRILQPNLAISQKIDGSVEVFNHGQSEINLYGFKLQAGNQYYAFPLDTIISAGKKVVFPAEYLKINNLGNVTLLDVSNQILAQAGTLPLAINVDNTVSKTEVEKFVVEYNRLAYPKTYASAVTDIAVNNNETISSSTEQIIPMTATVMEAVKLSFWNKLFHPIRTIQNAFYK